MSTSGSEGKRLLAVWIAGAATVLVAAAVTDWLCPGASYGYQMVLWLLFLVTPFARYEGPAADGGARDADS